MNAPAERHFRLTIEYDGTGYLGWQRQETGPSIEAELQQAIHATTGQMVQMQVAGRTDAGVHALGQCAGLRLRTRLSEYRLAGALNAHLPDNITVHRVDEVPEDFSVRYHSIAKRYRYRIYQGPFRPALLRTTAWHIRHPIDIAAMQAGAEHLIGEHDFESYRSVHCDAQHAFRRMNAIDINETALLPNGRLIDIVFFGNAFCRHSCRILAGTLLSVGVGRRQPEDIAKILAARDRTQAGITAPAHGLTLLEVLYPEA